MKTKFLQQKIGLSLIELLIAIGLLSIVLAVGYLFYSYGTNTFYSGESQSNVQRDVRIAAARITKEIRNADKISASAFSGQVYYSFKIENNQLIKETVASTGSVLKEVITNSVIKEISFEKESAKPLKFQVIGNNGKMKKDYLISTDVYLNNNTSGTLTKTSIVYFTIP